MDTNELVEQQIRLYQSRLRHLDELVEKARKGLDGHPQGEKYEKRLADILQRRDTLQVQLDELVLKDPSDRQERIQKAGFMAIWEVLAQDLEELLEQLGV
ncbi:MAG TPA: hypothetical protein EYP90_12780 [Chromatiaceae bacterium]|nr:hypothetical protein [Chromatiaceae bacterium]